MEEFQKDLRNGMSLAECCKEHSIALKDAMDYLVLHNKKKTLQQNKKPRKNPNHNLYYRRNRWYLEKRTKKIKQVIATFQDLEDAKIVRDELKKCDWDLSQLKSILHRTGIHPLPKYCILHNKDAYIQPTKTGTFMVRKGVKVGDGWKWVFYGTYDTIEDARKIRDGLIKYNWQKSQLWRIKRKYGIKDSKGR